MGRITIVGPRELRELIEQERAAFVRLYPEAQIALEEGSSGEAVRRLLAATCDLAVVMRELDSEEREAALGGGLALEGYRFARDAIVILVHAENPVENLTLEDVRRIYSGELERWSQVGGGDARIEPVVQTGAPDLTEAFLQQVMAGSAMEAPAVRAASDSEVVAQVRRRPNAIGYASLAWAERGAHAVRLSRLTGLPFWKPDLEAIHEGEYPLSRLLNLYVRASGPPLANGFITFVTSREGQMLVHEQGYLPTSIPLRFVRRSPLQPSH